MNLVQLVPDERSRRKCSELLTLGNHLLGYRTSEFHRFAPYSIKEHHHAPRQRSLSWSQSNRRDRGDCLVFRLLSAVLASFGYRFDEVGPERQIAADVDVAVLGYSVMIGLSPLNNRSNDLRPDLVPSRHLLAWRFLLRTVAAGLFVVYLGWNVFWWSQGRFAPALFVAIFGLPSPTTGGTRAIAALAHGQWSESLRFNAMALPLCLLFAVTLSQLAWQAIAGRRLSVAVPLVWGWGLVLILGWILKLAGDPSYW